MMPILASGKRVVNIDETWLPSLDFRNHKWGVRGERNTIAQRELSQRVNMIAALDTEGAVYAALTQVNTDTDVMVSFLSRLATVMTREDKDWRTNTIWLLDGASYHKTPKVRITLRRLGVKYVISGPYSYSAAPVELFFSYFKRGDLNPNNEPTGKR